MLFRSVAAAPADSHNGDASTALPVLRAVDFDGDGTDEIVESDWYDHGGDMIEHVRVLRRDGPALRMALDVPIAWDSRGSTGPDSDGKEPKDERILARYPRLILYRAAWELLPATATQPPRLRVIGQKHLVGPKTAYRDVAARFVRGCVIYTLRSGQFQPGNCRR